MNTVLGITAEYDPFHKGHVYQLNRARELCDPEAVLCVMSGNFTQRGLPATLDKWTRAQIAVQYGVDLVFELPFMYACSRAERFAAGAVDLLVSSGVTHISFGCEAEKPGDLQRLADAHLKSSEKIRVRVRELMKEGCSRAKAGEIASRAIVGDELTELMLLPNNILALEYLKRLHRWRHDKGVHVVPVPVRRHGSGYRSASPRVGYAGGTAIRQMLSAGDDIDRYLPYDSRDLVWTDVLSARHKLYEYVRAIILRSSPEELSRIWFVGEGMENRLIAEARKQETYEGFLSAMVSRRYTSAAIRRIMVYILMNIDEVSDCEPYGKILAASEGGRRMLRQLRERIPVIANTNRLEGVPLSVRRSLAIDARATDMFNLLCRRDADEECDARQHPWIEQDQRP